jgi:hypothetical protein
MAALQHPPVTPDQTSLQHPPNSALTKIWQPLFDALATESETGQSEKAGRFDCPDWNQHLIRDHQASTAAPVRAKPHIPRVGLRWDGTG